MPIAKIASRREGDASRPKPRHPELLRASFLGGGEIDFSIVVPAHNRPIRLGQCLQAIGNLAYPVTRYEVIVVDDGSEESVEPVIVPFLGRLNLTLLRQSNSGPAGARNAGAAAARGRYVAFTDDDCQPDPGWLGALAGRLTANPGCAAGGKTINGLAGNLFSSASQVLIDYLYRHWNRDSDDALFIASNNLAFPRARFAEIRGFDANFPLAAAEDRELCERWRSRGGRLVFAPDAIVNHFHALNLKTFLVQHFNYGRGALMFRDIRRRRAERRAPIQPGSFYLPLLNYAFTCDRGFRGLAVVMLVGLSQIAMPLGYLHQLYISRAETSAESASDRSRDPGQLVVPEKPPSPRQ
jgi:glycosyltransferase involved in cell wall biosynthesis